MKRKVITLFTSLFLIVPFLVLAQVDIEWTHTVGVSVNGNSLTKTGVYGWNAGAVSKNKLAPDQDGWIEMTVQETNTNRYFGFSEYDKDLSGASIKYALYFLNNAYAYIYENGVYRGNTRYATNDIIRLDRTNGMVTFLKNGEVFFTADNKPNTELIADVSLLHVGATITNAKASFGIPVEVQREGYDIVWTNLAGAEANGNTLTKTGSNGWHIGGGASKNKLAANTDGWVETTVDLTNEYTAFGLSAFNKDAHYNSIHYSIYFHVNGTYYVYESGQSKGTFGRHYKGDIFSVEREGGKIVYKQNGRTFYTSDKLSEEELIADAAIHNQKVSIQNARASFAIPPAPIPREGYDVVWTNSNSVIIDGNNLTKTGATGWNGGAVSENSLATGEDGWLEFTINQTDKARMIGFAEYNKDESYTSINYVLNPAANGKLYIYEKGVSKGDMGFYYEGDILSIDREGGKIIYKQNGRTIYESNQTSTSKLLVDVSLSEPGGTLKKVRTSFPVEEKVEREGHDVVWTNLAGAEAEGNTLTKTGANGWHIGGGASKNKLAANTDGWVETTVELTNEYTAFGLSACNKDANHNSIEYSVFFHVNGTYYVYESGVSKGVFGRHYQGDVFSVERESGKIVYKQNGRTFYTSSKSTAAELIVDASIHNQNVSILNVRASFAVPPVPTPRDGYDVVWTNGVNVEIEGNSLTKLGAKAWNAGAASKNFLEAGKDGWVEFTATETDKHRIIGLAQNNQGESYPPIDFAIYLHNNGHVYVYEKGASRGDMGFYYTDDIFSIERENGKITYKRNGKKLYISQQPSSTQLLVDASLDDTEAKLKNVRTSFPVKEYEGRDGYDVVWTDDVGVAVRGNTLEKTFGASWANAGAASQNLLPAGQDGWIEVVLEKTNTARAFGLSLTNVDENLNTIAFALYAMANGTIEVYESGKKIGTFGTYYSGDIASVERENGSIVYKLNGRTLFTSTNLSADPLVVDASLYTQGASLENARTSFDLPKGEDGNDGEGIVAGSDGIPVQWTDLSGTAASYNSIKKIAANGWGNGGAISKNLLKEGEDGWVEILVAEIDKARAFGLSTEKTDNDFKSIDYALLIDEQGKVHAYENGTLLREIGTAGKGTLLAIERIGTQINYKIDNVVVQPSKTPSQGALIVDAALHHKDATIFNAVASFGIPEEKPEFAGGGFFVHDDHEGDPNIRYSNGKVTIGNDSIQKPGDYRLYVEDGILTEEVIIALKNSNEWADYVFEEDYPLNSIKEVEQFIKNNKHLPNVPSAKEVAAGGLSIGKMDATLLRQIEELWLHTIAQEKRMKALEKENAVLSNKLLLVPNKE